MEIVDKDGNPQEVYPPCGQQGNGAYYCTVCRKFIGLEKLFKCKHEHLVVLYCHAHEPNRYEILAEDIGMS